MARWELLGCCRSSLTSQSSASPRQDASSLPPVERTSSGPGSASLQTRSSPGSGNSLLAGASPRSALPRAAGGSGSGGGGLAGADFKLFGDIDICLHEELSCEMLAASPDRSQQEHHQPQLPQQPQAQAGQSRL
jgi:hypothetical protein